MDHSDMARIMTENAKKAHAIVAKSDSFAHACRQAAALTLEKKGTTMAAPGLKKDRLKALKGACHDAGLTLCESPLRDDPENIHTAFTVADFAIAKTGTLALDSASEDVRIATMLAEIHVAVLWAADIQADSMAAKEKINRILKRDEPSYLAFVTGPSRTADIERELTLGSHGPRELRLFIIE